MFYRIMFFLVFLTTASTQAVEARLGQVESTPVPSVTASAVISLQAPSAGQAVQGKLIIQGNTAIAGFARSEITFAYQDDPTDTWFLISQSAAPIQDNVLTEWDTTTISDGTYTLRLTVVLSDGSQVTTSIPGLRVRNYTPIETETPIPTATPAPGQPATATVTPEPPATPIPPTATNPPANPAAFSREQVASNLYAGALVMLGLFGVGLFILWIRSFRRKE